jgi:hypothetical protein
MLSEEELAGQLCGVDMKPRCPKDRVINEWLALGANRCMNKPLDYSPTSRAEVDPTNMRSIIAGWDYLTPGESWNILRILEKEVQGEGRSGNHGIIYYPAWGMKRKNQFTRWCSFVALTGDSLLSAGSLLNSMLSYTKGVCGKNLKSKTLNPYTTRNDSTKWLNQRSLSISDLFRSGKRAMTFVIHENDVHIPDHGEEWISSLDSDFKKTRGRLMALKRSGVISDYFYSHECSATSISSRVVHPHTHVVFWADKGWSEEDMRSKLKLGKAISMGMTGDNKYITWKSRTSEFENYLGYITGVYDWSDRLSTEWNPDDGAELVRNAREMAYSVAYFFLHTHKTGCGGLEKNPDLQKATAKDKIDRTKSCANLKYESRSTEVRNVGNIVSGGDIQRSLIGNSGYNTLKQREHGVPGEDFSSVESGERRESRVQKGRERGFARRRKGRSIHRGILQRERG